MKTLILILICCFFYGRVSAQESSSVKTYYEKEGNVFKVYADNSNFCPVSIYFEFSGNNTCGQIDDKILLKANSKRQYLFTLASCKGRAYNFEYTYKFWYGDTELLLEKQDYVYRLPYQLGSTFEVIQGYFGDYSHQTEHSIDFGMPEGTPVHAMWEGIVVAVKNDSDRGGADVSYVNDGNYVLIYHSDGSFAYYYHFKQNGVAIKEGDRVSQGQLIGYSGNTGWSSVPHLHITILTFKVDYDKNRQTYPTVFKIGENNVEELQQGKKYTAY